ncbi:MAG: LytTR family DNA-binding domain-containing protein [Clostridium sp.]|nr:LytTR family DNA-binding domain-containing protein [Clostridium sp.]
MSKQEMQITNLRIAVCDDIAQDAESICACVMELTKNSGTRCGFDIFGSGEAMLERMKTGPVQYDLCFIDILMDGINGIETASAVKTTQKDCKIVFVTSSREYAVDAFSLNALHYLIKPITKERLAEVFKRFSAELLKPYIMIFDGTDRVKVFLDNILYLESAHDCNVHSNTYIITKSCRMTTRSPLSETERLLGENFLKLHRGLIVNMAFIERMGTDKCTLKNGTVETLSRDARSHIREKYKGYLSNRIRNLEGDGI